MPLAALARELAGLRAEVAAEADRRRRLAQPAAVPDLTTWALEFFPAFFTAPASRFHLWLSAELGKLATTRGVRLNVLAPRGSAKSTWASFALPLWAALHGTESYIILTADTITQAAKYLDAIKLELESNEALGRAYPHATGKGPVWRGDCLRLRNGVMIEAAGTGSKLRGRRNRQDRPSLIVVDDPQNTEHVISPVQRDRSWEWLTKDVCNAGGPATNIVALGTALHRECIVCRLQTTPGWRSYLWRALESWPTRMDLWREWEAILHDHDNPAHEAEALDFYNHHKGEMDAGAVPLWPEREDLYSLMTLWASIGQAAFSSEKQNDPVNPELCEWPSEYFDHPAIWFDEWPQNLQVKTIALDPSKGKDAKHGDYSAFVKLGRDSRGVLYLEADLQRRTTEQIVEDGIAHAKAFDPDGFAVEANQFQELLVEDFLRVARREKVHVTFHPYDNTVNKLVRIRRLTPYLAQRLVRFKRRSPGTQLLVQQLRDFPQGAHDDAPDAAELALRLSIDLFNKAAGGRRVAHSWRVR
jgi:predicted phage terminase large subunit-like protein